MLSDLIENVERFIPDMRHQGWEEFKVRQMNENELVGARSLLLSTVLFTQEARDLYDIWHSVVNPDTTWPNYLAVGETLEEVKAYKKCRNRFLRKLDKFLERMNGPEGCVTEQSGDENTDTTDSVS